MTYPQKAAKRIILFAYITGFYMVCYLIYIAIGFFKEIPFSFTVPLIAYCVYSIWFNANNFLEYRKDSLYMESKQNLDMYKLVGIEPFNHRAARRNIFWLSSLAITANIALIIMNVWWQYGN